MATVVTGAAGFIGRALVQSLLDRGKPVFAVDRRPLRLAHSSLTVHTCDLLDALTCGTLTGADANGPLRTALESADAVYHLAGCPGVRDAAPGIEFRRRRDNVLATSAVLSAVPPLTRVVVTSSSSVYGGAISGRPCTETDPLRPRGGYAKSKADAERVCLRALRKGGRVTIVRPFTVAGEGQRADMALARWVDAARTGQPLRVFGSLDRTRDVTDVRDVVRAMTTLAEFGVDGKVNIGTGVPHSLRSMVAAIADVLGVPIDVRVEPASAEEPPDTLADTAKLWSLTGVTPRTDLHDLIARQAAYVESGLEPVP